MAGWEMGGHSAVKDGLTTMLLQGVTERGCGAIMKDRGDTGRCKNAAILIKRGVQKACWGGEKGRRAPPDYNTRGQQRASKRKCCCWPEAPAG